MPASRKPTALKVLQGTNRKDRANPNEPIASYQLPTPPSYLSEVQVEKFSEYLAIIERMKIASADDVNALAQMAVVTCELEDDTVLLAELGSAFYIPNPSSGVVCTHPAANRLAKNRQRVQAFWNEFGLTPAARSKVSAVEPQAVNPFAQFDKIGRRNG